MEQHLSSTQPQPPAFAAPKPTAKVAKVTKPLSAAKVTSKVAKAKPPESRKTAKGVVLRCMVGSHGKAQCGNPARWQHGKAWTCTTHHNAIGRGLKVAFGGKATLPYVAPSGTPKVATA